MATTDSSRSVRTVDVGRVRTWLRPLLVGASALALTATAVVPAHAAPPAPDGVRTNIVNKAKSQLGYKEKANNCNKYGKCEPWCAWFSTWVWKEAGGKQARAVKRHGFTGYVYNWGKSKGLAHSGTKGVKAGDMVFYGTGPSSPSTSTHVDIVIKVRSDNKLDVIGGNVSNQVKKRTKGRSGIYGYIRPYK